MILAALRLVFGGMAETILGFLWPALLLLVLLWVSAKLTLDLVGREGLLPALVLPALSPAVMAEFSPGRIDHHSIQIILALTMALVHRAGGARPALGDRRGPCRGDGDGDCHRGGARGDRDGARLRLALGAAARAGRRDA